MLPPCLYSGLPWRALAAAIICAPPGDHVRAPDQSFCERCGTRYTFESGEPETRRPSIKKARVLARGLKHFVLSDDSLETALAEGERDEDRERAALQLEAFHQTFNFCMDCRQYTCRDCWNDAEGRCLSCAPGPGRIESAMSTSAAGPDRHREPP